MQLVNLGTLIPSVSVYGQRCTHLSSGKAKSHGAHDIEVFLYLSCQVQMTALGGEGGREEGGEGRGREGGGGGGRDIHDVRASSTDCTDYSF